MAKKRVIKKSKIRLMTLGVLSIFFIAYFCFTFISYAINYSSLKKEEVNLNNELVSLKAEKKFLKTEIQKLHDPAYIVRYAKENYLYSVDGEYVIKLDKDNKKKEEKIEETNTPYIVVGISTLVLCILFLRIKKYF